MKRVREIDLEAPVREEEDGDDDGDGEDTCTSSWDERSFTKKARWIHTKQSETSQRHPQAEKWPSEPARPYGTDTERYQHSGNLDSQARLPGIKEIKEIHDERQMPFAKPKTFAGFDLQISLSSNFPESNPQHENDMSQFETREDVAELEQNSSVKDCRVKEDSEKGAEQTDSKESFLREMETKQTFPSPPAVLFYSVNDRQDVDLHSVLESQGALLSQAELSVQLEAISFIGQRVELIKERGTRKFVTGIIQQQLCKEKEPTVIQALVKVLCSVALTSCADDSEEEKNGEWASSVARVLLQYMTTKDLRASALKSALKVQILRSLYLIGKGGGSLTFDSVGPLAKEQLGSSNPRLRECGIRLLVQSINERNVLQSRHQGESGEKGSEYLQRSRAEGESLMHTLLEYTRDPYPNVREAVVWGILKLHNKGFALKHNTYKFAVALLCDSVESVRICAIKLVGICVKAMAWVVHEGVQSKFVDNAFLQICNMMTDMIMNVRQEACNVLAEMTGVSDGVLLQSLTKKVLATSVTEKESSAGGSSSISDGDLDISTLEENKLFDWSAAGAFVVGLEDEYWEVRSAAINALAKLGISSEKMAQNALELMVDMINDDSSHVRQQTIQALADLAVAGRLSILEAHLHMFLGILEDSNMEMRKSGHILLSVISLPSIATFQLTIQAVLTSLDKHPEDEESLLFTLKKLGESHASHTESIVNELVQELRGLLNGESGLDEPRCVAIVVLLLGAAACNGKIISLIPPQILSIASLVSSKLPSSLPLLQVVPLGFRTVQYSWSLADGPLSTYLSTDSHRKWPLDDIKDVSENVNNKDRNQEYAWQGNTKKDGWNYERRSTAVTEREGNQGSDGPSGVGIVHQRSRLYQFGQQEILYSTQQIVASALGTSLLLDIKAFKEVLQRLSGCRKEIKALRGRCLGLSGMVSFYGLFLQCLILVVQLRANFVSQESRLLVKRSGAPQDLLNKLDSVLKHLVHRFLGFRFEQILQILELHTLISVWKLLLYPVDHLVNDGQAAIPFLELESAVATANKIMKSEDVLPSLLLRSVQEQLLNEEGKTDILNIQRTARQLALSYWPRAMSVASSVKEMWAVMMAPGSDFDHPIRFIAGLPLGIPIDVSVYNVPDTYSLWVQFVQDTSAVGYKLLDVEHSGTSSMINSRHLSTLLQLNEMPPVASSMCRICIVLEGVPHQGIPVAMGREKGPKGCIVPLCIETEVHLFRIRERGSKQLPHGKR